METNSLVFSTANVILSDILKRKESFNYRNIQITPNEKWSQNGYEIYISAISHSFLGFHVAVGSLDISKPLKEELMEIVYNNSRSLKEEEFFYELMDQTFFNSSNITPIQMRTMIKKVFSYVNMDDDVDVIINCTASHQLIVLEYFYA